MNVIVGTENSAELIIIGFHPGELLLESINKVLDEYKIRNGIILTGYGTLKSCHLHYVQDTKFPPTDIIYALEKPLELISMDGIIADGSPHIHISVACGKDEIYGGHLENNSEVLYLAEMSILKLSDIKLIRQYDVDRAISLLNAK